MRKEAGLEVSSAVTVAGLRDDLTDGTLGVALAMTERGTLLPATDGAANPGCNVPFGGVNGMTVRTSTDESGGFAPGATAFDVCNNWSSTSNALGRTIVHGSYKRTSSQWTQGCAIGEDCGSNARLYWCTR